jgi:hypothetical protein
MICQSEGISVNEPVDKWIWLQILPTEGISVNELVHKWICLKILTTEGVRGPVKESRRKRGEKKVVFPLVKWGTAIYTQFVDK